MDRRIKYTKNIIKTTFLKKLEEKEINKITVSEICKEADVNRATFYRYYLDVYDLLDSIEAEFVDNLRLIFKEENYTVYSFALKVLNIFLENKEDNNDLMSFIFTYIFYYKSYLIYYIMNIFYNRSMIIYKIGNNTIFTTIIITKFFFLRNI